jgi:protein-disulfide isomerase
MHDALFQEPEPLHDDDFDRYAEALELDVPEFDGAMSTRRFLPRVRNDFRGGIRSGVNGTPSFFINNVRHDSLTDFQTLFSAVLNAMGA